MARIFHNLFLTLLTITIATSLIASLEVSAQDKEKKDDKKDDKKDSKDTKDGKDKKDVKDKKDDKDHKDIKKEPFKVDTPAMEFVYVEKEKESDKGKRTWVYAVAFSDDGKTVAATYR